MHRGGLYFESRCAGYVSVKMKGGAMPGRGFGIFILLVVLVLPTSGMAKGSVPTWRTCAEDAYACSGERLPFLTASDLFTIDIPAQERCFDNSEHTYIRSKWISTAEILGCAITDNGCAVEDDIGEFEDSDCDFAGAGISDSFLLDFCRLRFGFINTPLLQSNAPVESAGGFRGLVTM